MDNNYYYRTYRGEEVAIEKEICISVAKPNIMRTEKDLEEKIEKAIFPYKAGGKIIDENELSFKYPKAYDFLLSNKQLLLERDKWKAKNYLFHTWRREG